MDQRLDADSLSHDPGIEHAIGETRRRLLGKLTSLRHYLPPAVTSVSVTEPVATFSPPPEAA